MTVMTNAKSKSQIEGFGFIPAESEHHFGTGSVK